MQIIQQKIETLYEDQDVVVINKPALWVVNNAVSVVGQTIQDWWSAQLKITDKSEWEKLLPKDFSDLYGRPEQIFTQRGGIVHRLDKDTSGAMILAKNPGALCALLADFKSRKIHKVYQCLVYGRLKLNQDVIKLPLARNPRNKQKISVDLTGRPAETAYLVTKLYRLLDSIDKNQDLLSLVECRPLTGRMHQIRVHMAHIGHPIVGDEKYAGRKRTRRDRAWCARQFLHATQIEFFHPRTKKIIALKASLSQDLKKSLDQLTFCSK